MAGFGCTQRTVTRRVLRAGENKVIGLDEDHVLAAAKDGIVFVRKGDSGGPAFMVEGVRRKLVGVSALSDIARININVRLDSKLSQSFFRAAARLHRLDICGVTKACD